MYLEPMKNTKKAADADLYAKGDEFLTQEERISHKENLDKQGISWGENPPASAVTGEKH